MAWQEKAKLVGICAGGPAVAVGLALLRFGPKGPQRPDAETAQTGGGASGGQPADTYKPRYRPLAHRTMELHAAVPGTQPNYRLPDSLIDRVKTKARLKKACTREEALAILEAIDTVLIESNFLSEDSRDALLPPETRTPQTVSPAALRTIGRPEVRERAVRHAAEKFYWAPCSTYSFLYLGIADALGLPLRGVLAPRHTSVRRMLGDGRYVNWETTIERRSAACVAGPAPAMFRPRRYLSGAVAGSPHAACLSAMWP